LALDFSRNIDSNNDIDVTQEIAPEVTPCNNGLWYLYGAITNPQCGSIPDASSSSSSSDKHVLADALVGLFVGFALLVVVVGFIYYKWIAKGQSETAGKSGMGMELNDTQPSIPVAVPAAQLTVETPANTSGETTKTTHEI